MRRRTRPSEAVLWILVGLLALANLLAGCGGSSASSSSTTTKAPTATTTTITSSLATATSVGQGYSVTVSVSASGGSGSPTGTATVVDGSGASCVATLTPGTPSTGTCMLTSASAGTKTITASYSGDNNFLGSTSAGVAHLVNPATQPAAIISPASEAFTIGNAGTFTVAATGSPAPALTETGALPSGLTFTDNGNGTATLTGTPASGTSGTYSLMFTASNGVGSNATQNFSLGVNGNFGFVTNNTGGNVTVIDLTANAATGQTVSLSAGATPQGIAINPVDTLFGYVANGASKDVQVFCTRVEGAICPTQFGSPTIGGAIKAVSANHAHVADSTGVNPAPFSNTTDVVIASTGLFGFVVDNGAGMVYKIDTNRTSPTFNQILGSGIPIPGATRADIRPAADFVYVADGKAEVVAVNTGTGAPTTIPISVAGTTSYAVAASPDGSSVYVTDPGNGQVDVISSSLAPGTYVASTFAAGSGGLLTGAQPHGIRFSPDGRFIYVADNANNVVATIDPATLNTTTSPGTVNVVNNRIPLTAALNGIGPEGVALTANTDEVVTADDTSNTATAIDGNLSDATFRTALATFGSAGTFSGAFGVATMPNPLLHVADPVPDAVTGAPYDWQVIAAGGAPPYSFAVTSGSLPSGLAMDGSGHITGTPTASGDSTFTVTVTDGPNPEGQAASQTFDVKSVDVSSLLPTSTTLPDATVNVPYSASVLPNTANFSNLPLLFEIETFGTSGFGFSFCQGISSNGFGPEVEGTPFVSGTCSLTEQINYVVRTGDHFNLTPLLQKAADLKLNIGSAPTSVVLTPGFPNPSACQQPVTFNAVVTSLIPGPPRLLSGSVTFSGGPSCVDTTGFNSNTFQAACTYAFPAAGTYPITATYHDFSLGTSNFSNFGSGFSSSMATVQQVVNCGSTPTPTSTNVVGSPNPSIFGQPVIITNSIVAGAGTPNGSVTDSLQEPTGPPLPIATPQLDASGTASTTISTLPVGSDTILSNYPGNSAFAPSSSSFIQAVNKASTTTTGSPSLNPVIVGQPFMLNAVVAPQFTGSPTGTVNFFDASAGATCSSPGGSTLLASNGVANGTTTVGPLPLNSAGTHIILSCYGGDSNFTGSGTTFTVTVNKANTQTTLTSSLNPEDVGQSVTFLPVVTALPPSIGAPLNGTVTFTIDGVAGSPVSLLSGGLMTSSLTQGTHVVTVAYSGDSNSNPSDSTGSPLTETVNPTLNIITQTPFGVFPDALAGFPYSQTIQVTGGTSPLTFSALGDFTNNVGNTGTACQGLSLNSTSGVLSGTPAVLGTCGTNGSGDFGISVIDAAHGVATTSSSILVRERFGYIAGPGGVGPGGDDTVEVINTRTKSFVSSIDTTGIGVIPTGIASTRNGRFALVNFNFTQLFPSTLSRFLVIDTLANTTLGPFNFTSCTGPKGVAIGTVPIATIAATGAVRSSDSVTVTTTGPHGLAIQDLVTITGMDDSSFDGTFLVQSVTSANSFTYLQTAPDGTSGNGSVSDDHAYVGCSNSEIGLIDMSANSGNPTDITPSGLTSIGNGSSVFDGIAITPDDSKVFAVDSANGQFYTVATATNAVTGPLNLCTNPKGIAITPAGDRAYVACDANTIAVINTGTNAVSTITTMNMTATDNWNDVAITPDGFHVYVTAANTGNFTVIDNTLATPTVIPTSPINISGGALQGIITPPLLPLPPIGISAFFADSTTGSATASNVDIRDDSPVLFPADSTPSIGVTPGALNPAPGTRIGFTYVSVPYPFITASDLSPAPAPSTPYTSAPLVVLGGVGAIKWNGAFSGVACGNLAIGATTGIISGTPGATGSGSCNITINAVQSPVTGPRPFDAEAIAQFNFRF